MKKTLFVISIFTFFIKIVKCSCCGAGGWVAFADEKCFKLVDRIVTQEEAERICNNQANVSAALDFLPTLASIKSPEEQQFLERYLFVESGALEPVWISAKRKSDSKSEFQWSDESQLEYENWAKEGNPTGDINRKCVQIQDEFNFKNGITLKRKNVTSTNNKGKWVNVPCEKRNLVLCEELQTWSFAQLQKSYIETRKNLIKSNLKLETLEIESKREITALKQNPVPIGFIYIQLPGQSEPMNIWPMGKWIDVTSDYAGLFFRAEGGGSAAFGQIQSDNSPRLIEVQMNGMVGAHRYYTSVSANGEWSNYVESGADVAKAVYWHLRFKVSAGEVRPRNKAIRIWKRMN